jgi:hypothetical protein
MQTSRMRPGGRSAAERDVETGAGGGGRLAGPSIATSAGARWKFLAAREAAVAPIGGTERLGGRRARRPIMGKLFESGT